MRNFPISGFFLIIAHLDFVKDFKRHFHTLEFLKKTYPSRCNKPMMKLKADKIELSLFAYAFFERMLYEFRYC